MSDRIWIWFADNGNIRKWQHEPFPEGTEYVVAAQADAELEEMTRSCLAERAGAASLRSKLEEAEGALEKCQRVMAMLTDGKMSKPSVVSAFAQCVEAELAARRTLASLREADHA